MSEYWKSTPKYWCKHCNAYVKDTPFERKQHENTGKHQGNLKRFLRGIQNDQERGEREKEKVKAEVERLNKVVGGQSSSSVAVSSQSKPSTIRKPPAAGPTAVDQKRQWAQLAEMGIQVPDSFRGEMAMASQWQTVSKQTEDAPVSESSLSLGVRKRKIDVEEDEAEFHHTGRPRGWGSTVRRYPGQDETDLDALLSESIIRKDTKLETESDTCAAKILMPKLKMEMESPNAASVSMQRFDNMPNDGSISDHGNVVNNRALIKSEEGDADVKLPSEDLSEQTAAPVFKKRKSKVKATDEKG